MNHQKIIYFIILTIFTIFYTACSTKKVELPKEEKIESRETNSVNYKLKTLSKKIIDNCGAKTVYNQNNTIFIKQYPNYLHLNLGETSDFRNGSYIVLKNSNEKLKCIMPILKEYSDLYIVITGHADSKNETSKKQHLSDNRAITVAEEFFDAGVRDEIYVKGCSDKTLEIDAYHKFSGKKVNFYIYADKSNIKNHCK